MGTKHLSRLASPNSWNIRRKDNKWVMRPLPGAHPLKLGMPLTILLRDILSYAKNSKEAKFILNKGEIFVDGKVRKEPKFIVGLMDIISIPNMKTSFRILLNNKGKLVPVKIKDEDAKSKLSKIINKSKIKGNKIQLNLSDGRNIIADKDSYKVGDVVLIELSSNKIIKTINLEKGAFIILNGGKHIGDAGLIEEIEGNKIIYKKDGQTYKTLKKYAFAIGRDKPLISLG